MVKDKDAMLIVNVYYGFVASGEPDRANPENDITSDNWRNS